MTCRTDTAGTFTYAACTDDPPLASDRLRAVVRWSAVDEITERGPNMDFTIRTQSLGLTPRIARDGYMGLVGNPLRLYPDLDLQFVDISWTLDAPGYLTRERTKRLGPIPGFPANFAPAEDGVLALHRAPFVVRGRAVQPVPGVLVAPPIPLLPVAITGVWWTFPPADQNPNLLMKPANLVSLHPGLHTDQTAGTHTIRRRDLVQVLGQDKTLVLPAVRGTATAKLSNRVGVVAGTVLAFDAKRPDRIEYGVVTDVTGASTADQPATVTLAHRLLLDHDEATDVFVVAPQLPGPSQLLVRDGIRADRVAFCAGMAGIAAGVVEIGSGPTLEYQTASLYSATTDSEGYYRLPPLSRVASVKLQTPALTLVLSPDYGRYENLVDLVHP